MSFIWRCLIAVWLCRYSCESSRVKRGFCSTRTLDIDNGDYRLRSGNSIVDFTCNTGYQLYGIDRAVCFGSKWSSDPPLCIANTCPDILETDTLKISQEYGGAILKFQCAAMYKLKGERTLICDRSAWSAPKPDCIAWKPPVSCDFEDPELCGWSHHDKDDQDWRWNSGKTSTSRTGPSHDHTLGAKGDGHYMYFETSSPTRVFHKAILQSPLYPAEYSKQACFTFWYHILGESDMGEFEVFVKPESVQDISTLNAVFHTNENRGDIWLETVIRLNELSEPFQILMVATRGTGYRSDYAFDDVSLARCADASPEMSSSTTQTVKTSTLLRTTKTTAKPTIKTTLKPTPTTTINPTTTTVKTTTTLRTTTAKPTTAKPTTTVKTTKAPTTQKSTARVTTFEPTQKQSTSRTITTTSATQQSDSHTMSKETLKPIVNPNLPSLRKAKHIPGENRTGPSIIVWVVLGAALLLVVIGAAVGVIWYRRKHQQQREKLDPLCSTNPLYTAVNGGDEATVHFASEEHGSY